MTCGRTSAFKSLAAQEHNCTAVPLVGMDLTACIIRFVRTMMSRTFVVFKLASINSNPGSMALAATKFEGGVPGDASMLVLMAEAALSTAFVDTAPRGIDAACINRISAEYPMLLMSSRSRDVSISPHRDALHEEKRAGAAAETACVTATLGWTRETCLTTSLQEPRVSHSY